MVLLHRINCNFTFGHLLAKSMERYPTGVGGISSEALMERPNAQQCKVNMHHSVHTARWVNWPRTPEPSQDTVAINCSPSQYSCFGIKIGEDNANVNISFVDSRSNTLTEARIAFKPSSVPQLRQVDSSRERPQLVITRAGLMMSAMSSSEMSQ